MTPGDRCHGPGRFKVMVELVCDEDVFHRCLAEQTRGGSAGKRLLERGEPALVEQDFWRSRAVFSKAPDRADKRIVVGHRDRNPKFVRDPAWRQSGKTR